MNNIQINYDESLNKNIEYKDKINLLLLEINDDKEKIFELENKNGDNEDNIIINKQRIHELELELENIISKFDSVEIKNKKFVD